MIEVKNLTKQFGSHRVVNTLNFTVAKGEIVGFLGPNGAGKTTTLRMLTGYVPPSFGSATIAGYDMQLEPLAARRAIGYMPENVPLYHEMKVREYLSFRARIKGLDAKQTRHELAHVLERCHLQEVRNALIGTLSKGYRQRVGLADALLGSPPLLILDEPTNGLDPTQIRHIRQTIADLAADHTVLLSTHILSEVERVANRVIIIDQGLIKADGTPAQLTASMRAAGRISLEIEVSDAKAACAELSALAGVRTVTIEGEEDRFTCLSLLTESACDPRVAIAELAASRRWPLRSLTRRQGTLEDVFVELTRKD